MAEQVGDCDSEQQRYSDWDMTDGSGEEYGVKNAYEKCNIVLHHRRQDRLVFIGPPPLG